jgi:hypothetical protein
MKIASKTTSSPQEDRAVAAAVQLMLWEGVTRNTISVDAHQYMQEFRFIPILHTVHDQAGNPVFIILEKQVAIESLRSHYGLSRN